MKNTFLSVHGKVVQEQYFKQLDDSFFLCPSPKPKTGPQMCKERIKQCVFVMEPNNV